MTTSGLDRMALTLNDIHINSIGVFKGFNLHKNQADKMML
jgi:hypothetical protein